MLYADHITQIEIASLWAGRKHIQWQLHRKVNVLSGGNGAGKTTIFNRVIGALQQGGALASDLLQGIPLGVAPSTATHIRYDALRPLVVSELDERIRLLLNDYHPTPLFYDLIDRFFATTNKTIVRDDSQLLFTQYDEQLTTDKLSSGEKQLLVILLTVLRQKQEPTVLFLDEPEVSLHIDWQKDLINSITTLNPKAQILLITHSPAIIMNGWLDCVTEISDIIVGE